MQVKNGGIIVAEIRKDIITGELVIISPERGKRPHDFKPAPQQKTDTECPFCPGNESMTPPELFAYRDNAAYGPNEKGWSVRAVPNLYSPLQKGTKFEVLEDGFYKKVSAAGTAEVFIETPDHNSTLGTHPLEQVVDIIKGLKERYLDLTKDERLKYIQIFKNFGEKGGASKEHAHWQIMSVPVIPPTIKNEIKGSKKYYDNNNSCPYCDIIKNEINENTRIVKESSNFIALCPYASRFAFETWILPKEHSSRFENINSSEVNDLAEILKEVIHSFEKGFSYPPYNIVLHTMPIGTDGSPYYHWHLEILPRLTIFAGFEWGSGVIINPTPPELAAQSLKEIQAEDK